MMMCCWLTPLFVTKVSLLYNVVETQTARRISTKLDPKKEVVLMEIINNKGVITLSRPEALNCINLEMISTVVDVLRDLENKVELVVIRGKGDRAFSSGGDILSMSSGGPSNCQYAKDFFRNEYTANYIISQYRIPYIALIDGITMGGGKGLAVHGKYQVATERTLFAMPETAIGHVPDIGASHFLPKLEGKLGLYLALTGQRLKGKDVVKLGLGTHFVESKVIPSLFDAVVNDNSGDIDGVLRRFTQDVSNHTFSLTPYMDIINNAFSEPTVEEIFKYLEKSGSEFSTSTLQQLKKMSPIALKICKKQLEKGSSLSLKECLKMEFRIAVSGMEAKSSADFYEGVRALITDKDQNPRWNPPKLEDVTEEMVDRVFQPLSPEEELKL